MPSPKSHVVGDNYDHLIALSCTFESGVGCAMEDGELTFESLDGVIKGVHLRCLDESKGAFKRGMILCLERGKTRGRKSSNKAATR